MTQDGSSPPPPAFVPLSYRTAPPRPASPGSVGGAFRLFQLFGITVYLHWSWLVVALYEVQDQHRYSNRAWAMAEYLTLFVIVTLHEFGHALACRSVGGRAERIVLWPLGGIAYVSPPPRPGALLWSIAAGPLVNVALLPVTIGFWYFLRAQSIHGDLGRYGAAVAMINGVLLVFNLLPIYPLDGGQILQALLWFMIGRANSLLTAAIVGLFGAAGLLALAAWQRSYWMAAIAIFSGFQAWAGVKAAQGLRQFLAMPRHEEFACPACGGNPPKLPRWRCGCGTAFDTFETAFACPGCGQQFQDTQCPLCGRKSPARQWIKRSQAPSSP